MEINEILEKIGNCEEIITIKTTPARLFILVTHLQLALRFHEGESAEIAREMAENMSQIIYQFIPEAEELLEAGWNEVYDITRNYFEEEF